MCQYSSDSDSTVVALVAMVIVGVEKGSRDTPSYEILPHEM